MFIEAPASLLQKVSRNYRSKLLKYSKVLTILFHLQKNCITTLQGHPVGDRTNLKTSDPRGPGLIEDVKFLKEMGHFDRERIPERVVHAKGAGAFGEFKVTQDITKYTKASVFSEVGKVTKTFLRFSQVAGELGAADTVRDVRGFAVKMYTDEGIWDLVGNNLPIFFIRDPRLFSSFIHTQKRNPQTHLRDANMVWDFLTLRNESTQMITLLYSDLGTPASYRHMDGFGVHAFKLVNKNNDYIFCKFNWRVNQGIKNMTISEATKLAGESPDYLLKDLYDSIASKQYPSWTLKIQIMTVEEAKKWKYNPFDATKVNLI